MRARVFLWSTPGLALMKHFAILSSNKYEYSRGVFFHLGIRVFAKVRFSKCTSLKIVPKAAFAVHFLKKGKNVLYRR